MKILNVIDDNAQKPIIYSKVIENDLKTAVEVAAKACSIAMSAFDISIICQQLSASKYTWCRNYCFEIVELN